MQKILLALSLITLTISIQADAQGIGSNCATYMRHIFYYAEKGARFSQPLDKYFKKALPEKAERKEGAFKIKLLIDSAGKLDCLTIEYNTTSYTAEEIRDCIDGMPEWLPATQNGYPVTFCAIIEVAVTRGNQTVTYLNERRHKPK
jgi:hypothetical protein